MTFKSLVLFIALALLASCAETDRPEPKILVVKKVVKAKREATETDYQYQYDWLNGKFRQQPRVATAYYLVYEDGSYDRVELGRYSISSVGDTVAIEQRKFF